jgi:hypothetical protein
MKTVFLYLPLLSLELINVYNLSRPSHNKVMRKHHLPRLQHWPQPSNLLQLLRPIMGVTTEMARQFMHCFASCNLFFNFLVSVYRHDLCTLGF